MPIYHYIYTLNSSSHLFSPSSSPSPLPSPPSTHHHPYHPSTIPPSTLPHNSTLYLLSHSILRSPFHPISPHPPSPPLLQNPHYIPKSVPLILHTVRAPPYHRPFLPHSQQSRSILTYPHPSLPLPALLSLYPPFPSPPISPVTILFPTAAVTSSRFSLEKVTRLD